eukprot:PhM_4_TR1353/c1_g1_i1/m.44077
MRYASSCIKWMNTPISTPTPSTAACTHGSEHSCAHTHVSRSVTAPSVAAETDVYDIRPMTLALPTVVRHTSLLAINTMNTKSAALPRTMHRSHRTAVCSMIPVAYRMHRKTPSTRPRHRKSRWCSAWNTNGMPGWAELSGVWLRITTSMGLPPPFSTPQFTRGRSSVHDVSQCVVDDSPDDAKPMTLRTSRAVVLLALSSSSSPRVAVLLLPRHTGLSFIQNSTGPPTARWRLYGLYPPAASASSVLMPRMVTVVVKKLRMNNDKTWYTLVAYGPKDTVALPKKSLSTSFSRECGMSMRVVDRRRHSP